jgi:hypothetical protein
MTHNYAKPLSFGLSLNPSAAQVSKALELGGVPW